MFNSDIPAMLEAVHTEFWENHLGPPPAIWTVWVAECCVYVCEYSLPLIGQCG
jgi:hypothetical protein